MVLTNDRLGLHNVGISTSMTNWKEKLAALPELLRKNFHQIFSQRYMQYLDKGLGTCVL